MSGTFKDDEGVLRFPGAPPPPVDIIEGQYSSYQSNGRTKAKITIDIEPLSKERITRLMRSKRVQVEVVD